MAFNDDVMVLIVVVVPTLMANASTFHDDDGDDDDDDALKEEGERMEMITIAMKPERINWIHFGHAILVDDMVMVVAAAALLVLLGVIIMKLGLFGQSFLCYVYEYNPIMKCMLYNLCLISCFLFDIIMTISGEMVANVCIF